MNDCFFLGSALHTHLGRSLSEQLIALGQLPSPPDLATALYAGNEQSLPYMLLHDSPLHDPRQRFQTVLDSVIGEALESSQLDTAERAATGLFVGTSSFDISVSEAEYREGLLQNSQEIALAHRSSQGILANTLRQRYGLNGVDFTFNTACTASANALMYADAMIRSGQLQHALVVGVEIFNSLTSLGFAGLQLLTRDGMRPFDSRRNGLILGEGCSALVLGASPASTPSLINQASWQLRGSANLCDTHSMSAANPDGSTVAEVMLRALQSASLQPDEISAIKTHGTASLLNDEAEATGMLRVFHQMPPLTALKPFIGHTLGACGLNELLLFCGAAEQGWLPAIPDISADASLGISLPQTNVPLAPGHFMLNYFGFGGNNTSLIVSNVTPGVRGVQHE